MWMKEASRSRQCVAGLDAEEIEKGLEQFANNQIVNENMIADLSIQGRFGNQRSGGGSCEGIEVVRSKRRDGSKVQSWAGELVGAVNVESGLPCSRRYKP